MIYFIDGFDHYATAELTRKWDYVISTAIAGTNQRRTASSHVRMTNSSSPGQIIKTFSSSTIDTVCLGFAMYFDSLTAGTHNGFRFRSGGGDQCTIRIDADGSVAIRTGSHVGTVIETSIAGVVEAGRWHWFEAKVYIHDTAGTYDIRVDGVTVIDGSDVDTKGSTSSGCDNIRLSGVVHTVVDYLRIDDLFIGTDFLGDSRCDPLWPVAAGQYAQWTPSAGANYANVDEPNDMDDDTTYNSASVIGKVDCFAFGELKPLVASTIHAVALNAACRKEDANARHLTPMTRVAATDYDGTEKSVAAQTYGVVQHVWELNPDDAGAWEEGDVNASQFAYKLTTEAAATRVTQLAVEVLRATAADAVAPPDPVAIVVA